MGNINYLQQQLAEAKAAKTAASFCGMTVNVDLPFEVVVEVPEELKAEIAAKLVEVYQAKIDNLTALL